MENFGQIAVVNRLYGDLALQCLGHAPSGVLDLVWISEEVGQAPAMLSGTSEDSYTRVSYDYNVANLTVDNFIRLYRGTLRCQAASSNIQVTVYIAESKHSNASSVWFLAFSYPKERGMVHRCSYITLSYVVAFI